MIRYLPIKLLLIRWVTLINLEVRVIVVLSFVQGLKFIPVSAYLSRSTPGPGLVAAASFKCPRRLHAVAEDNRYSTIFRYRTPTSQYFFHLCPCSLVEPELLPSSVHGSEHNFEPMKDILSCDASNLSFGSPESSKEWFGICCRASAGGPHFRVHDNSRTDPVESLSCYCWFLQAVWCRL